MASPRPNAGTLLAWLAAFALLLTGCASGPSHFKVVHPGTGSVYFAQGTRPAPKGDAYTFLDLGQKRTITLDTARIEPMEASRFRHESNQADRYYKAQKEAIYLSKQRAFNRAKANGEFWDVARPKGVWEPIAYDGRAWQEVLGTFGPDGLSTQTTRGQGGNTLARAHTTNDSTRNEQTNSPSWGPGVVPAGVADTTPVPVGSVAAATEAGSTAGPRSSTGLGVDPFAQPDLSQALETFGPREDLIRSLQRAADNAK
ncbi:MAG: hypothetical protein AAF108_03335, partial [Planctomycetota bacterium]